MKKMWQFHAVNKEILEATKKIMIKYNLFIYGVKTNPFCYKLVNVEDYNGNIDYLQECRILLLCFENKHNLPSEYWSFLSYFQEDIFIDYNEHLREGYIREAGVGINTDDNERLKVYNSLVRLLKKDMYKGMTLVSLSGNSSRKGSHYYSKGILEAYKSGIKIKAFAGEVEYIPNEIKCDSID